MFQGLGIHGFTEDIKGELSKETRKTSNWLHFYKDGPGFGTCQHCHLPKKKVLPWVPHGSGDDWSLGVGSKVLARDG